MSFKRFYVLEASAQVSFRDTTVLDECRYLASLSSVNEETRTADEILSAAGDKGYEVRYMVDFMVDRSKEHVAIKTWCENRFRDRLKQKGIVADWVGVEFKAQIYVPREAK